MSNLKNPFFQGLRPSQLQVVPDSNDTQLKEALKLKDQELQRTYLPTYFYYNYISLYKF